ncbi:MAG: PAS domain-containing sensor histidine kinase [Cyclobacteriaceae bacterium]
MNHKLAHSKIGGLQHIIDNIPAVVFEYTILQDGSGDFTYLSPRCEELLGLKPEVLLSGVLPMKDFIHQEDWAGLESNKKKSIEGCSDFYWEGRLGSGDNTIWVEAKGSPVVLEDGSILYSGIINNISKRKRVEFKEIATENEHKKLLEFLPIGIAIHVNGKLVYINKYGAEMLGAEKSAELVGMEIKNLAHPDYRDLIKERIAQVMSGKPTLQIEEKFIRLDGKPITVLSSGLPIVFNGVPAVQNIVLDVTEQRDVELEIKKAEMLFSQLFHNAPLAIVMLNAVGRVVKINKGFQEMFGYHQGTLENQALERFIVPKELEEEGSDLNSIISSYNVVRLETVRVNKDGERLSVIIYGVPVRFEDETIGIFGLYVDITERKMVEEELKVRNSELDNFVYKVSHDLRAPLSSILGLVHLSKLPDNTDSHEQYLEIVGKKATQLDHFIGDVLSHSKNLKMEFKVSKIDFHQLIEDSFADLTYLSGAENVKRNIAVKGNDFYSDLWRIKEVFRNLISNAIKYRNHKHQTVEISITIEIEDRSCHIIFTDNGIGIDDDKIDSIFEMFYRASEISEGSGLGLYIVKNAIYKLKGTIMAESTPGYGTTFTIILPNEHN